MSNVIVIAGQKGGTGKSTISVNMAVMLKLMGHDVKLIDATKKQSSSHKFINRRHDLNLMPTPSCSRLEGKYLNVELKSIVKITSGLLLIRAVLTQ
jgi:chromosome partitioning protein